MTYLAGEAPRARQPRRRKPQPQTPAAQRRAYDALTVPQRQRQLASKGSLSPSYRQTITQVHRARQRAAGDVSAATHYLLNQQQAADAPGKPRRQEPLTAPMAASINRGIAALQRRQAEAARKQAIMKAFGAARQAIGTEVLPPDVKKTPSGDYVRTRTSTVGQLIGGKLGHSKLFQQRQYVSPVQLKQTQPRATPNLTPQARKALDALNIKLPGSGPATAFVHTPPPLIAGRGAAATGVNLLKYSAGGLHATAGALNAALEGKGVGKVLEAGGRGLISKDTTTYSDVLKTAGVKNKTLRTVLGTALDFVAEPTPYGRFSRLIPQEHLLSEAARLERLGKVDQAAKLRVAARDAPTTKGLQAGVRVKVPFGPEFRKTSSGATTARLTAASGLGKAATKVRESRPVQAVATRLAPDFLPKGIKAGEFAAVREANAKDRARKAEAMREAQATRESIDAALKHSDKDQVIAAIERGPKPGAKMVVPFDPEATVKSIRRHSRKVRGATAPVTKEVRQPGTWYHASRTGLAERGHETTSFEVHLGTRKAATERAKVFQGDPHKIEQFRLPENARVLGSPRKPLTERELGTNIHNQENPWQYQAKLRELRDKGYDAVYYRNEIEDPGSVSLLVLDRRTLEKVTPQYELRAGERKAREAVGKKVERLGNQRLVTAPGEHVRVSDLVPEDQAVVRNIQKMHRDLDAAEAAAGIRYGRRPNYLAHIPTRITRKEERVSPEMQTPTGRRRAAAFGFDQKRTIAGSLGEIEARGQAMGFSRPQPFSTEPGTIMAIRQGKSLDKRNLAAYYEDLSKAGERVSAPRAQVPEGYAYYAFPKGKTPVKLVTPSGKHDLEAVKQALKAKGTEVRLMNPRLIDPQLKRVTEEIQRSDPLTRAWKYAVTQALPSYHVGNLLGDIVLGLQADTPAKAFGTAVRGIREINREERFARSAAAGRGEKYISQAKPVKLANGEEVPLLDLVREARGINAIRTGIGSREIFNEVAHGSKSGRNALARGLRRFGENREDFPRLATYIAQRQRGLSPEAAAEFVGKHHIDYGDLTSFEDKVRTAQLVGLPFYTFFARNTRLQAEALWKTPGKIAAFEKTREEAIKNAGYDVDDFEEMLNSWQKRGAPLPIEVGKQVLAFFPKTPIEQGLSNISGSPNEFLRNVVNHMGPAKLLVEIPSNYSLFFGEPIEDSQKGIYTPAPDWVGAFATVDKTGVLKRALGLKQDADGHWQWPGRVDYIAKSLPESNFLLGVSTSGQQRHGSTAAMKAAGFAGFKFSSLSGPTPKINKLYDRLDSVEKELRKLKDLKMDRDKSRTSYTEAYSTLLDKQKAIKDEIATLKEQRGDEPPDKRINRNRKTNFLGAGTATQQGGFLSSRPPRRTTGSFLSP